jgi:hypothetical protein
MRPGRANPTPGHGASQRARRRVGASDDAEPIGRDLRNTDRALDVLVFHPIRSDRRAYLFNFSGWRQGRFSYCSRTVRAATSHKSIVLRTVQHLRIRSLER